jgi:hypothetical protein
MKTNLFLILELELWNITMDRISTRRRSYVYMSAGEMMRQSLMEGEVGRIL